ncbi:MAG: hypothetical protein ACRYGP_05010 [Janthinobacterium lividum]
MPVIIEDMSFGGLRIKALRTIRLPLRATATLRVVSGDSDERVLEAPVIGAGRRTIDQGQSYGLKFYGNSGDRFRIIAQVLYSDIAPIRTQQLMGSVRFGLLFGTAMFLFMGATQIGRGLLYATFHRSGGARAQVSAKAESPLA